MKNEKTESERAAAARLSISLGTIITRAQIRWWRGKGYDLENLENLKLSLRNQERTSKALAPILSPKAQPQPAKAPTVDPDDGRPENLAHRLVTDAMISDSRGTIPVAEFLEYLRDRWEGMAASFPHLYANKSTIELADQVAGDIEFEFLTLKDVLPAVNLTVPDWLAAKPISRPVPTDGTAPARAPFTAQELDAKIAELETQLLSATDYETARTLRIQISGVRELFRLQVDRGNYVTAESQVRTGLAISRVIRAEILKIPAELPQALVGLAYPAAVARCEDFADRMIEILGTAESYVDLH